jgi:hypothetical protein
MTEEATRSKSADGTHFSTPQEAPLARRDEPEGMGTYAPESPFASAGLIVPPVSAEQVRSLYQLRANYYTALLDPEHDFLYSVSYVESGKPREYMTTSLASAQMFAQTYKATYKARPRRAGVEKLAESLGIQGEVVEHRGLPGDKNEDFAWVRYKATHLRTGRVAYGVGWCDTKERASMSRHALIATADSRAFSRAVLRLIGYGEVGAEEILAGISEGVDVVVDPTPPAPAMGNALPVAAAAQVVQSTGHKASAQAADRAIERMTVEMPKQQPAQADPNELPVHVEWSERKGMQFAEDGFAMEVIRSKDHAAPRLTSAQCAEFSRKMIEAFEGDKDIAKRFLRQHAGVASTTELHIDQVDRLESRLKYITTGVPF